MLSGRAVIRALRRGVDARMQEYVVAGDFGSRPRATRQRFGAAPFGLGASAKEGER
jgi:hypothetical protein